MYKTDLWALGSSLSSGDAGLDVLVVPELCLVPPMLSPSNGVCFTVSPRMWLMCASTRVLNGLRFPKRFIQR